MLSKTAGRELTEPGKLRKRCNGVGTWQRVSVSSREAQSVAEGYSLSWSAGGKLSEDREIIGFHCSRDSTEGEALE